MMLSVDEDSVFMFTRKMKTAHLSAFFCHSLSSSVSQISFAYDLCEVFEFSGFC